MSRLQLLLRPRCVARFCAVALLAAGCVRSTGAAAASASGALDLAELTDVAPRNVTLVVRDPSGRPTGRLRLESTAASTCGPSIRLEFDPVDGPSTLLLARALPSGASGEVHVGGHVASWRVAIDRAGHASGERWRSRSRPSPTELASLEQAWALTPTLTALVDEATHPRASADERDHLAELARFAELAMDASLRASTRHGRASLGAL